MFQNQNQAGLKEASTFDSWRIAGCMSCVSWAPGQVRIGHHVTVHGPVHSRVRGPSAPRPISLGINHGTKDEQAASCRGWGSSSVSRPVGVGDAVHTTYYAPRAPLPTHTALESRIGYCSRDLLPAPTHMRTGHRGYSCRYAYDMGIGDSHVDGVGHASPRKAYGAEKALGLWTSRLLAAGCWPLASGSPGPRVPAPGSRGADVRA